MTAELTLILSVLTAFLAGAGIAGAWMRSKTEQAVQREAAAGRVEIERLNIRISEKEAALAGMESRLAEFNRQLTSLQAARSDLARQLAVAEHLNQTLPELKSSVDAGRRREQALQIELAEKTAEIREFKTRLEETRKQSAEKIALLEDAKKALTNQFQVLAQDILDEKGKTFRRQSQTDLQNLLDPFRDQLNAFKQKVNEVHINDVKERAALKNEIESLRDLNRRMTQETLNLTQALKGDRNVLGAWGEMVLERVLEQSGLRKDAEYEIQSVMRDAGGRLKRPDVVVHLPEGKDIIIDSKVSLVNYERYVRCESSAARAGALASHVQALRSHIDGLSRKDYPALQGVHSLDFVLMFMPIEAAFAAAVQEAPDLYTYAFTRGIVVVTPSTLLATLKTIESIWRYERQNRHAEAIFTRASALYDKLRLFLEGMEKLGKQLETAHNTYDEVMNRLSRGKGNVISQASRLSDLGVFVKKPLPQRLSSAADAKEHTEGYFDEAEND